MHRSTDRRQGAGVTGWSLLVLAVAAAGCVSPNKGHMADACVGETCVPAANGDDAAADAQSSDGPATDLVASADQSEDVPGPAADGPSEVGQPIDAAIDVPSPDVGVPPDGAPALRANGEACSAA